MSENYVISITLSGKDKVSEPFKKVQKELDELDSKYRKGARSGSELSQSFDLVRNAALTVGGALVGMGLANAISEMNAAGVEARRTALVYDQLTSSIGGADAVMQALKKSTGGVVDATTLQAGASRLLGMGLAENIDQVNTLTQLAVKLGGAFAKGSSASDNIDNFSLMLANKSYQRLDSFGIASDRVRAKVQELLETGQALNEDEAFKLAVMEVGAQSLERLGSAADASVTALARIQTRWADVVSDFQVGGASIIETLAQVVDIGLTGFEHGFTGPTGMFAMAQDPRRYQQTIAAQDWSRQYISTHAGTGAGTAAIGAFQQGSLALGSQAFPFLSGLTPAMAEGDQAFTEDLFTGIRLRLQSSDAQQQAQYTRNEMMQLLFQGRVPEGHGLTEPFKDQIIADVISTMDPARVDRMMKAMGEESFNNAIRSAVSSVWDSTQSELNQQAYTNVTEGLANLPDMFAMGDMMLGQYVDYGQTRYGRERAAMMGAYDQPLESLGVLEQMYSSRGGIASGWNVMTRAEADVIQAMAQDIADQANEAKEAYKDLLTEDQKSRLDAAAQEAKNLASAAKDAADNFERMSLPEMMGQGGGGRMGELTDQVIAALPPDLQDSARRRLDLMTGRSTDVSNYWQDTMVPQLADIYAANPQAGEDAMTRAMNIMENARLQGLSGPRTITALDMGLGWGFAGGGGGQNFTVQPGQTPGEIAYAMGVPVSDVMGAAGIQYGRDLQPGTYTLGGGTGELMQTETPQWIQDLIDLPGTAGEAQTALDTMTDPLDDAVTSTETLQGLLDEIASGAYTITLDFEANLPAWLQNLMTSAGVDAMIADSVQRNGGQPPGTTTNNGQTFAQNSGIPP